MTAVRRDGRHQDPFLQWIRHEPRLDSREFNICVTDTDVWIHRFSNRMEKSVKGVLPAMIEHIQLIEVKSFSADMPFAQRDTFDVVDRLVRRCTSRKSGDRRRLPVRIEDSRPGCHGRSRWVRWLGVHMLQMSADRPDNSDCLIWDRRSVDLTALIELLRFDRDPDNPTRFLDTRRHHAKPQRNSTPPLLLMIADGP
jgi:hypothetical protein